MGFDDVAIALFALLEADAGFPPSPPLNKQSHDQCGLERQQGDNTDDAVSITLPESGFNEQDLGIRRQVVLVQVPALEFSPVKCQAARIRPGDRNRFNPFAAQDAQCQFCGPACHPFGTCEPSADNPVTEIAIPPGVDWHARRRGDLVQRVGGTESLACPIFGHHEKIDNGIRRQARNSTLDFVQR